MKKIYNNNGGGRKLLKIIKNNICNLLYKISHNIWFFNKYLGPIYDKYFNIANVSEEKKEDDILDLEKLLNGSITETAKKKKKRKKKQSLAAQRDYFARSFGYVDYNDYLKKYVRIPLLELKKDKPMFLVGKLSLDLDDEDKKFYTFVNIKPFCPGYEVTEIVDHLNISKAIVHKWYHRPDKYKDDGIYFVFECRINQYETMISKSNQKIKVKRYGIDVVNEIPGTPPFFCARGEFIANHIPENKYLHFEKYPKINRYVRRKIDKELIFRYRDLDFKGRS